MQRGRELPACFSRTSQRGTNCINAPPSRMHVVDSKRRRAGAGRNRPPPAGVCARGTKEEGVVYAAAQRAGPRQEVKTTTASILIR
jgi:hypothetical protein